MLPSFRKSLRMSLMVSITAATAATAALGQAQSLATLSPGTRVQLVLADSLRQGPLFLGRQVFVGTLVRVTIDSVWLQPKGTAEFSVAHGAIIRARASRGVSRMRSALTFGLGLSLTAAAVQLVQNDARDDVLGVSFACLGVGVVVGAISPFEHWRRLRR